MGCDIHCYVEMFNKKSKKWVLAHGVRPDPWEDDESILEVSSADRYDDRDYTVFGILTNGNVRHEGIGMFNPKGFPADASDFVKKDYEHWDSDAHTPSYLTFAEIKQIPLDKTVTISGMMKKEQLKKLKVLLKRKDYTLEELNGVLYPYCGSTNMDSHDSFEVEIPIKFEIKRFLDFIKRAREYSFNGTSEMRIVFWFDN